jgi:hypothetical protein
MFAGIPWLAHRLSPAAELVGGAPAATAEEALVFGGRRISGFLVVADGEPLRSDIPTLHLSTFAEYIKLSVVELYYQGLLQPRTPDVPFGFVYIPKLRGWSNPRYIVPAHVLEQRDVPAWRFTIAEWNLKSPGRSYWFYVTRAEPLR